MNVEHEKNNTNQSGLSESMTTDRYLELIHKLQQGFCIIEVLFDEKGQAHDYRFLEVNPVFEKLTGLEKVVGKSMRELQPNLDQSWVERYAQALRTGRPASYENQAPHMGDGVWYEVFAFPFGPSASNQLAVVFSDNTARKQQELLQNYLVKLNDALRSLMDPVAIEEAVTECAMQYFNLDRCFYCEIRGDEAIILRDAYKKELSSAAGTYSLSSFPLFKQVLATGRAFVVSDAQNSDILDAPLKELCNQLKVISFIDVPVMKAGRAVGMFCLVQATKRNWTQLDVDWAVETAGRIWTAIERTRAERELRENEHQLRQLIKQKDIFISAASHELKTPVTNIKGYTEIVRNTLHQKGDLDSVALISKLNAQIDRLTGLINQLLVASDLTEGRLPLAWEETDLNQLIRERIGSLKGKAGHSFRLQLKPLPNISIDRERILQVMSNLVSNAIKYSPSDSNITISTVPTEHGIKVTVSDEGLGVGVADLKQLFARFFRNTDDKLKNYPGMGLGLFIAAQIIQQHGGLISVESIENKGSKFSFYLPFKNPALKS